MTLTSTAEAELVARLRAGDEQAFETLVARLYGTMLAVARTYVKDRAVAEEVVQDTWLGVINGLERFEGRSSLKTWILSILVNQAKTRGTREARTVPFAALARADDAPAVAPEDVAVFEAHLELCDGCRFYVEQMRITIDTVGRIEESEVPDEMRATLMSAFRARTRRE